jgi:hypothetical protein
MKEEQGLSEEAKAKHKSSPKDSDEDGLFDQRVCLTKIKHKSSEETQAMHLLSES